MNGAPTVSIFVPGPLRKYSGGASNLPLAAADVATALSELERQYPGLYRSVCDETGAVRRHVNLFVNENHMRDLAGLKTKFAQNDILTIMPAVSGG